jgi:hypothetical protein
MSESKNKLLQSAIHAAVLVVVLCEVLACSNTPNAISPFVRESSSSQQPIYSRDSAPVLSQLPQGMSRKDRVEAARNAGLQVTVDEKPWGDIFIVYSDPATHSTVLQEHIIVDRFPIPKSTLRAPH